MVEGAKRRGWWRGDVIMVDRRAGRWLPVVRSMARWCGVRGAGRAKQWSSAYLGLGSERLGGERAAPGPTDGAMERARGAGRPSNRQIGVKRCSEGPEATALRTRRSEPSALGPARRSKAGSSSPSEGGAGVVLGVAGHASRQLDAARTAG